MVQSGIRKAVAAGRYLPPRPYFAEQATASDAELTRLRAEAKDLQAVVDNPATPDLARTKAKQRLTAIRVHVEALGAALHPVKEVGKPATAGNVLASLSWAEVNELVQDAMDEIRMLPPVAAR
jgi:hypothetical protein